MLDHFYGWTQFCTHAFSMVQILSWLKETLEFLINLFLEFHYPGIFLIHTSLSLSSRCLSHAQPCFYWAKFSGRCCIVCPSFPLSSSFSPSYPLCLFLFCSTLDISQVSFKVSLWLRQALKLPSLMVKVKWCCPPSGSNGQQALDYSRPQRQRGPRQRAPKWCMGHEGQRVLGREPMQGAAWWMRNWDG